MNISNKYNSLTIYRLNNPAMRRKKLRYIP